MKRPRRYRRRAWLLAVALAVLAAGAAAAHEGPPYPILVDRPVGPVLLSVWADPDVGTGTYHVYLEPLGEAAALPAASSVRIFVRPASGRLPERGYDAEPFRMKANRQHFVGEVEFDAVGEWVTRVAVRSGNASGEAATVVEVTPPGQGPLFDFVLYLLPFLAVGFLVVRALVAGRRRGPKPAS